MKHSPPHSPCMGRDAEVETGPKGEVANARLIAHSENFVKKLVTVTDGVYHAIGVGLANSTMVEGEDGIVIIDTGDCIEQAEEHYALFKTVTDKPVKAVIYTHSHYVFGTRVYVPEEKEGAIPVWAHERAHQGVTSYVTELAPIFLRGAGQQLGMFLPAKGPDAAPNIGLGPYLFDFTKGVTSGYVKPTHLVSGEKETTIAGMTFRFASFASDTVDTLIIWIPSKRVAVNNHFWPTFANISALRGVKFREPDEWIGGLDYMRRLQPDHLVNVHGPVLSGSEVIQETLLDYRDGIQFVYDQSIRGINHGMGPEDLVEFVKLPDHLQNSPCNQQFYGEVPHHVRQVYNGLMGWFNGDAATLHALPPKIEAEKIIQGFGGVEHVARQAQRSVDEREYTWAAQLANYLLRQNPENKVAKAIKIKALRGIGQNTTASNTRNFCLSQARALEGAVDLNKPPFKFVTVDKIMRTQPGTFVKALRVRLDPEKSIGVDLRLKVLFTDIDRVFGLHVRHGLADFLENPRDDFDMQIALTRFAWAEMVAELWNGNPEDFFSILEEKSEILPNSEKIKSFFMMFDQ